MCSAAHEHDKILAALRLLFELFPASGLNPVNFLHSYSIYVPYFFLQNQQMGANSCLKTTAQGKAQYAPTIFGKICNTNYPIHLSNQVIYPCCLRLLPTCAEKPVLMAVTLLRDPHELQVMKYSLFSPLLSSVSGDLQVLQVTYSTGMRLA
jgi:hypothetical protein